jgi:DME family drug/metabolite transporter
MGAVLFSLILVALAAITWGTTGTTLQLVGATSSAVPLVVGAIRMLVAAPLLTAGARLTGASLRPTNPAFLVAGLCMAAYQVCYFSAVPLAGVGATALLAICSAPILIAVIARVVLHEPITPWRLAAMALGVTGAGLLVGGAGSGSARNFLLGGALALGAGLAYSLYAVATKGGLRESPPLGLAAVTFGLAAIVLLPVLIFQPSTTASTVARGWPLLLYLGAIPTAGAYFLYTTALRRIPAGSAAIAGLLEPLTATVLGLLLFREHLSLAQASGAALLLIAMGLLGAGTARQADKSHDVGHVA